MAPLGVRFIDPLFAPQLALVTEEVTETAEEALTVARTAVRTQLCSVSLTGIEGPEWASSSLG